MADNAENNMNKKTQPRSRRTGRPLRRRKRARNPSLFPSLVTPPAAVHSIHTTILPLPDIRRPAHPVLAHRSAPSSCLRVSPLNHQLRHRRHYRTISTRKAPRHHLQKSASKLGRHHRSDCYKSPKLCTSPRPSNPTNWLILTGKTSPPVTRESHW